MCYQILSIAHTIQYNVYTNNKKIWIIVELYYLISDAVFVILVPNKELYLNISNPEII